MYESISGSLAATAKAGLASLLGLILAACTGSYEVTLNDRVVYDPFNRPANSASNLLEDPAFQACLSVRLADSDETETSELGLLACSAAGITTIEGIGALAGLEQLELSDNQITDLEPLASLENLRVLSMRNNRIRDIRVLRQLPLLRLLILSGNNEIPCAQLDALAASGDVLLTRPLSCRP